MTGRTGAATVAVAAVLVASVVGQAQLAFEVASVKESASLEDGGTFWFTPGGGIRAQRIPARSLITIAHGLQPYQLVGAPEWARQTYYDVEAKPAGESTREQTRAMLQALLAERFGLAFHRERRDMDGFALVRMRPDALGPNLHASSVDCEKAFSTTPVCRQGGITRDTMKAHGTPIWSLVQLVISIVGAPVSDETALAGTYDFELRWTNEIAPSDDRQSIFTALQEQLGLKLERRRVTTEVVVVDRLLRASPN